MYEITLRETFYPHIVKQRVMLLERHNLRYSSYKRSYHHQQHVFSFF